MRNEWVGDTMRYEELRAEDFRIPLDELLAEAGVTAEELFGDEDAAA